MQTQQRVYKKWTPELKQQFLVEWDKLKSDAEVAKVFGVTTGAAGRLRQHLGILIAKQRPTPARSWTEDKDRRLIEMRGKFSSSVIAAELNVTRGAVVGRAFRLGLTKLPQGPVEGGPRRPRAKQRPTLRSRLRLVIDNTAQIDDTAIPVEQRCTLFDLNESTCRWPVGDPDKAGFFFCGGLPVAGCPYCASHAMRAYQVTQCA